MICFKMNVFFGNCSMQIVSVQSELLLIEADLHIIWLIR